MARFTLTVTFDDRLSDTDGPEYAQMAATGAVHHLKNCDSITVWDAELVDDQATTTRHGYTVDYLEWCERDEANDEPERTLEEAVMDEWGHDWKTQPAVRRILGTDTYNRLADA